MANILYFVAPFAGSFVTTGSPLPVSSVAPSADNGNYLQVESDLPVNSQVDIARVGGGPVPCFVGSSSGSFPSNVSAVYVDAAFQGGYTLVTSGAGKPLVNVQTFAVPIP